MRYRLILSYDGSSFCGWQIQDKAASIQGHLQQALTTLEGLETGSFGYKLNAILPHGIVVHAIEPAAPDFHARYDARQREYKYFIHRKKDPFLQGRSSLYTMPLDVEKMNEAARALLGTHDFRCFEKTGSDNKTSICTVTHAAWETYVPDHVRLMGYPGGEGDYLVFTIRADRFLRNMVRAVVGSLLDVGRGRRETAWIGSLVASGTRSDAGASVPGHALFLTGVEY